MRWITMSQTEKELSMSESDQAERDARYNRKTNLVLVLGIVWFVGLTWLLIHMMPKTI